MALNRNLFSREMRRNGLSLVVWSVIISALISVTMSVYPTFMENQSKIAGMLSIIPKGALQFKGISNFDDLLSVIGFYAANNIIYMMLLGSIFAIVLSSNILLKEEYNKTAEYLLTRPVTRSEVFLTKASLLLINILILNLVTSVTGFIWLEVLKREPFNAKVFLILSIYTLLLNCYFGALGLLISTFIKRARPITAFSIGLVLILYFIYTLSKITESASKLGYISPFRFADVNALNPAYRLEFWNTFYFIGFSIIFFFIAFYKYRLKDIYT